MNVDVILKGATAAIDDNYFQLPIDGRDRPIYRERVYCYELYHQMRLRWPEDTHYTLGGEVDKSGHPLIRGNDLDQCKPDLLVHVPGDMGSNLAVIEVKPITASPRGIRKDLRTLTAFRRHAGYQTGVFLVYGDSDIDGLLNTCYELQFEDDLVDLRLIEVFWHRAVGYPAERRA